MVAITETYHFWIIVCGFLLLCLEFVILWKYRKKVIVTRKRIYNATIVIILGLIAQVSAISQIGLFLIQSNVNYCLASELAKMVINGTNGTTVNNVMTCVSQNNGLDFQLITAGVIVTVVMLLIQLRELVKNRDQ